MDQTFLRINEIFHSIQGESTWVGMPCVFVRLRGCPHRCDYCDTSYAFTQGEAQSLSSLVSEINAYSSNLVEITGGEPLAQKNVHLLIAELCDANKTVLLETSGSFDLSEVDHRVHKIVDIKTPCSGAANTFLDKNYDCLTEQDEVKFVITNKEDFDWAVSVSTNNNLFDLVGAVHCSPVMFQEKNEFVNGSEALDPEVLAQWVIESGLPFRCHLQIHKYIWAPLTRGV